MSPPIALLGALALGAATGPWRALMVGGGPGPASNEVAIEANMALVDRLFPAQADRRVLFAVGASPKPVVRVAAANGRSAFRATRLPRIDGPATPESLVAAWTGFARSRPGDPLLLYFAGHGRPQRGDLSNNHYELWNDVPLDVRTLAGMLADLPTSTPVVLVMTQCFSGSFANLLFEGGRPDAYLGARDFVGFFAATDDRPASGCTPSLDEASYDDFTTHFFAALAGRDRRGRPVAGADFDGSGHVGMREAYGWALMHLDGPDVPTSASELLVRHLVDKRDADTMATPYATVLGWAEPWQRAVLAELSRRTGLSGEGRLATAYEAVFGVPAAGRRRPRAVDTDDPVAARLLRFVRLAKTVVLTHELRASGDALAVGRFERMRAMEDWNPLVPVDRDAADR